LTIFIKDQDGAEGHVPLPEGWTLEEAIEVLREVGHEILRVTCEGKEVLLPEQAA
jgi:hypothetical protein